jgi:hypothetical protein
VVSTHQRDNYQLGRVNHSWYWTSLPHVYSRWVWEDRRIESIILFRDFMLKKFELAVCVKSCKLRWKDMQPLKNGVVLQKASEIISLYVRLFWAGQREPRYPFWVEVSPILVYNVLRVLSNLSRLDFGCSLEINTEALVLEQAKFLQLPYKNLKKVFFHTHYLPSYLTQITGQGRMAIITTSRGPGAEWKIPQGSDTPLTGILRPLGSLNVTYHEGSNSG